MENPNGFGANYANQPPASGRGPSGGQQYGVPNGAYGQGQYGQGQYDQGQQYGQGQYGQGQYGQGQYGSYGPWAGQGQPAAGQGQPAGGPAGQADDRNQRQDQGRQTPYGQPYAYVPPQPQPGQPGWQGQPGWNGQSNWYAEFSRTDFDPFKLIEEHLPQRAKNWIRAVYAVVGAAALVIGLALLVWPGPTLVVATVALAVYFVVSGIVRAVTAFAVQGVPGGWRVLDVLVGVLLTIGGIVMLKNTTLSASTLVILITSVVGISWIMEGVMSLAESWRVPASGWAVAYGLISIFAGFVLLVTPVQSTAFLVVFAGCALVVMGVTALVRAFKFGRAPKSR
ncbi:HdeD family acid-resistance protein [Bifidobacterium avesanii]|uniref:HdeD family acid-resistance protein n=1 Tax=Bifidobacterium avesanii TaxID=1798157 RepID=UPI001F1088B0|nr:HdeD family acid-resistance protein [Bifidobacterium avesanii]